jgi:hypothetical protein
MVRPHRAIQAHVVPVPAEVGAQQVRRLRQKANRAPLQRVRRPRPAEAEMPLGQAVLAEVAEGAGEGEVLSTPLPPQPLRKRRRNSARHL